MSKQGPRFFRTPASFRQWLAKHHASATELWVGYYRKDSGLPSITWPESVDEALCCGWIDGIRKGIDEVSYMIRFSPRKRDSTWSAVNIGRVEVLTQEGRMLPAGMKAFAARRESKSGIYAYEQREAVLPEPYGAILRRNRKAREFFDSQPPGYRKTSCWWVVSARKEETRLRRLEKLIAESARGRRL